MKSSFFRKLQRTARLNVGGALLLLLVAPALQVLVLGPQGYSPALADPQASLAWIQGHTLLFLLYRGALILGFGLLLGLPFALFRIIVAQEIIGRAEIAAREDTRDSDESTESEHEHKIPSTTGIGEEKGEEKENDGIPAFAWRGKGFAVIAAWTGLPGFVLTAGGTLASTIYLWSSASTMGTPVTMPDNFGSVTGAFAVLAYAIGSGLLALACIFFGLVIARAGRRIWPDSWIAFAYAALAIGAVTSGSAVQVALAPTTGQATLTTPAILLIAAWSLWFGIMVTRLKPA